MAVLKRIVIRDFRNIELQELDFSPNLNCIAGGNGEGKTNLLDAIHYLSMTKSAFAPADAASFRYGTDSFAISGFYDMGGVTARFALEADRERKQLSRDGKVYGRISDHIGVLPVVMVSPADIAMVSESGEERRRFANSVLSQMDREYLDNLQQYNRLLMQRNKLLKGLPSEDLLDAIDYRMARCAEPAARRRAAFAGELNPIVKEYYFRISSGREEVGIEYVCDHEPGRLEELLRSRRERDLLFKYTTAGIQRDDFIFTMNGKPIRRHGSQGQQKSFLVALKFAQYEIMKKGYGYAPTLLLDDLFDKLDYSRITNLLEMVAGDDFGQIFLSDCDRDRTRRIAAGISGEKAFFDTSAGVFTRE